MTRGALLAFAASIGCKPVEPFVCTADLAPEVNTVVRVSVLAPTDADALVEFGVDGSYARQTPAAALVADQPQIYDLVGLGPLTRATWRVIAGGEEVCAGATTTRNLPTGLPQFTLTTDRPDLMSSEPHFMMAVNGSNAGLLLINRAGEVLWYRSAVDAQWLTPYWHGGGALFNEFDPRHMEDRAMIRRVDAEGVEIEAIRTKEAHHMFTELPDGTLTYLRRDIRTWFDPATQQAGPVVADAIVERRPNGEEIEVFNAWESLEVRVTPEFYMPFYRDGDDWTHANAINYDATRGTYLTSFSNLDTMMELNPTTGDIRWFGIDGEDPYGYVGQTRQLAKPHDPKWTGPDTFTVFITDDELGRSGIVEYEIDEDLHALRQIWEFGFAPGQPAHRAYFLGQGFRLENGNQLVKWAQTGRATEVAPDGTIVWDFRLAAGSLFGEMSVVDSLYGEEL